MLAKKNVLLDTALFLKKKKDFLESYVANVSKVLKYSGINLCNFTLNVEKTLWAKILLQLYLQKQNLEAT